MKRRLALMVGALALNGCVFVDNPEIPRPIGFNNGTANNAENNANNDTNSGTNNVLNNLNNLLNNLTNNSTNNTTNNGANNSTNNTTNNGVNNATNNATNNSTNNSTNNTTNNGTNNSTNNGTNNTNNTTNNNTNNNTNNGTNNGTNNCVPETNVAFCVRLGAECGTLSALDNCQQSRNTLCGGCGPGEMCGLKAPNVCDCACTINGQCYGAGGNPQNPCQVCDPARSATAWSLASPGTACNDGNLCTVGDTCDAQGQCGGAPKDCNTNPCKTGSCDMGTGNCVLTNKPDTTRCDSDTAPCTDQICLGGTCRTGIKASQCYIGGSCYVHGDLRVETSCAEACVAYDSQTSWRPAAEMMACDSDPDGCGMGACNSVGACVAAPSDFSKNGTVCNFSDCEGVCKDAQCDLSDVTQTQCLGAGGCYAPGDANPLNACEQCGVVAQGRYGWKPTSNGLMCTNEFGAGYCQDGLCEN